MAHSQDVTGAPTAFAADLDTWPTSYFIQAHGPGCWFETAPSVDAQAVPPVTAPPANSQTAWFCNSRETLEFYLEPGESLFIWGSDVGDQRVVVRRKAVPHG